MSLRRRPNFAAARWDPINEGWWTKAHKFVPLDFVERALAERDRGNVVPILNLVADAIGQDVQDLYDVVWPGRPRA